MSRFLVNKTVVNKQARMWPYLSEYRSRQVIHDKRIRPNRVLSSLDLQNPEFTMRLYSQLDRGKIRVENTNAIFRCFSRSQTLVCWFMSCFSLRSAGVCNLITDDTAVKYFSPREACFNWRIVSVAENDVSVGYLLFATSCANGVLSFPQIWQSFSPSKWNSLYVVRSRPRARARSVTFSRWQML